MFNTRILIISLLICLSPPARAVQHERVMALQSAMFTLGILGTAFAGLSQTGTSLFNAISGFYKWIKPDTAESIQAEMRIHHLGNWTHIPKRSQLFYNEDTRLHVRAVFQKIIENAEHDLPQSSVLIVGPAGTGKTSLAISLIHDGFDVFLVSADEVCLRERLFKIQMMARIATAAKKRVAIVIDESEAFFECLSPAYTSLGSQARKELVTKFLTEFGTRDRAIFFWTANSVKELMSTIPSASEVHHKSMGVLRRFRDLIQVTLPDESTRRRVVREAIKNRIVLVKSKLVLGKNLEQELSEGFKGDDWKIATAGMSQDDLWTISENIVAGHNAEEMLEINTEYFLKAFETQKSSLESLRTAAANEKKAELARLKEEAEIVELRRRIEGENKNSGKD